LDKFKCLSSFGGLGKGNTKLDVAVEVLDFTVTDVNSLNGGESKAGSKGGVDSINVVLDEGVEFSSEGSRVDSKSGALDGNSSKRVLLDFTKDLSTNIRDMSNKVGTVILSNESLFSINNEGNDVRALEGSIFSGELELRDFLGQLDLNLNWDVSTVFSGKLRNSGSEIRGGNVDT